MAPSSKIECEFCFGRVKFSPRTLADVVSCKRCGQAIHWQHQVDDAVLKGLPQSIHSQVNAVSQEVLRDVAAPLSQMPLPVRLIAIMHAILMFYKVTHLLTLLITNKIRSPGHLIFELVTILFAGWTFYGIHYRSRATWLTLKNFSKFNMYLLTILGIALMIIFAFKRRQFLLAFFPVWGAIWLFFSIDYLMLKTKEARQFFNVVCPTCQSPDTKPEDRSFKFVRCKRCRNVWS